MKKKEASSINTSVEGVQNGFWKSRPRKKLSEMGEGEAIASDLFEDKCPIGDIAEIEDWLSDFNAEHRDPDIDPNPLTLQDLRLEIWHPIYLAEIDPDQWLKASGVFPVNLCPPIHT